MRQARPAPLVFVLDQLQTRVRVYRGGDVIGAWRRVTPADWQLIDARRVSVFGVMGEVGEEILLAEARRRAVLAPVSGAAPLVRHRAVDVAEHLDPALNDAVSEEALQLAEGRVTHAAVSPDAVTAARRAMVLVRRANRRFAEFRRLGSDRRLRCKGAGPETRPRPRARAFRRARRGRPRPATSCPSAPPEARPQHPAATGVNAALGQDRGGGHGDQRRARSGNARPLEYHAAYQAIAEAVDAGRVRQQLTGLLARLAIPMEDDGAKRGPGPSRV